jgi:flagellar basal-body rod modification protein FlgD
MEVGSATSTTSTQSTTTNTQSSSAASTVDYNSFLQLLVAQLKNQDPTEPMDSAQYMAQLASFSNVEQVMKTNAKLDAMMTSMALTQADGIIGRTLTSADGSISGEVSSIRIVTGGAVATLTNGKEIVLGAGVTVT